MMQADRDRNPERDEDERCAALEMLNLIGTPPEENFDLLTRLSRALFDMPIALMTLIGRDRQWIKSRQGLAQGPAEHAVTFAYHTIHGPGLLLVPDTAQDIRFRTNSLVVHSPFLRFCAGAPLLTSGGQRVGALCIMDTRPRTLNGLQQAQLEHIALQIAREAERRALGQYLSPKRQRREKRPDRAAGPGAVLLLPAARSQCLSRMSHQLRTSLNAILGFSSLMLRDDPACLSDSHKEYLGYIEKGGQSLMDMVHQVVLMSRLSADAPILKIEPCLARDLIDDAAARLQPSAQRGNSQIGAAAFHGDPVIHCDRLLLRQALHNILDNAVQCVPPGGTVHLSFSGDKHQVQFLVCSPEQDAPPPQDGATGFEPATGLAIAKALIEAHDGSIWYRQVAGDRHAVITLPRRPASRRADLAR